MADLSLDDIPFFEESQHSNPLAGNDYVANILPDTDSQINIDESVPNGVDESAPTVGMCFDIADTVKSFFRQYGIKKGFAIRTRSSKKGPDKELRYFILVCARAGNYVSAIPPELSTHPTQTVECSARITFGIKEGKWYIMSVHEEHSHQLSPMNSRLFHGNRKISLQTKRVLDINDDAGVRLNKTFRYFVSGVGGYENLDFVERDVHNYVAQSRRALGKECDGKALLNHFCRMRELNPQFYFDIPLGDDNRIRQVFWADARSRATWDSFGDILCFGTTYLKNKYDMPFAPFVGVNHHGQSYLLRTPMLLCGFFKVGCVACHTGPL